MTSPRILQVHLAATGLDRSLPSADVVGASFKFHINSALLGFSRFKKIGLDRRRNPGAQLPAAVPKFVSRAFGERAIGFFVTTEDGSDPDNRIVSCGQADPPMMNYDLRRQKPADKEHRRLVRAFMARLIHAGLVRVERYIGMADTPMHWGAL